MVARERRACRACYCSAMEVDIESLVEQVEKRPALYDTGLAEYHDRNKKKKLWEEICLSINSSWAMYSNQEKTNFSQEIQKKWSSLRDCFRRELSSQQYTPSGSGAKQKAKYRYFDMLLFLVPFTQIKNNESSLDHLNTRKEQEVRSPSQSSHNNTQQEAAPKTSKKRKTDMNQDIISILQEGNNIMKSVQVNNNRPGNDDEDDKLFLLSLLPSFKNYTMEEKYLLRIDIMKTVLNFKQCKEIRNLNSVQVQTTAEVSQLQSLRAYRPFRGTINVSQDDIPQQVNEPSKTTIVGDDPQHYAVTYADDTSTEEYVAQPLNQLSMATLYIPSTIDNYQNWQSPEELTNDSDILSLGD